MRLCWYCLTAVLITITHAAVDVEKTVQQVQNILNANSLLPRLSRAEIIQLLNDIKAEDARSASSSKENSSSKEKSSEVISTTTFKSTEENEIIPKSEAHIIKEKDIKKEKDDVVSASVKTDTIETTTKSSGPSLTVVLPYTPRDGSSLQELYTRPPRLEIIPDIVTPKPVKLVKSNIHDILTTNSKIANTQKLDLPAELQAFLDSHGLKSESGKDHFLLPLDGFKPLPPGRVVDGTVQLPENILLTYDLISPSDLTATNNERIAAYSNNNYLYEPLRPELPFELDTSSSEIKDTVLPYDLPKPRKPKAVKNYEPIDYDSIKVIPLNQGPSLDTDKIVLQNEQSKRQANFTDSSENEGMTTTTTTITTTTTANPITDSQERDGTTTIAPATTKAAVVADSIPSDSDSGASITDLEDSFGGAAPMQPGDSVLPPPKKNGFYWMVDWNSFLEVGDGDSKVNIRFEPKLGDPQMFLPVNVP